MSLSSAKPRFRVFRVTAPPCAIIRRHTTKGIFKRSDAREFDPRSEEKWYSLHSEVPNYIILTVSHTSVIWIIAQLFRYRDKFEFQMKRFWSCLS